MSSEPPILSADDGQSLIDAAQNAIGQLSA